MASKKEDLKNKPFSFDDYAISEYNRLRNETKYCSFCGKPLIQSEQDEFGKKVDVQWEQMHLAHFVCYNKHQQKLKAEAEQPMDWDKYMKEMMEKRGN